MYILLHSNTYSLIKYGDAISDLLEHPEKARQLGENGLLAFKKKFNWDINVRKLIVYYADIAR